MLVVKNWLANSGDAKGAVLIPGWGRFPGGGNSNPSSILSRKSRGQRSLVSHSPWSHKESDVTECDHSLHTSCYMGLPWWLRR